VSFPDTNLPGIKMTEIKYITLYILNQ